MFRRPKIGLALGGGGARGLAHIGVLKVLENEKIPIDIITGTSVGAIIGGMYAQNPSIRAVESKMRKFLTSKDYRQSGIEMAVRKQPSENLFAQLAETIKERIVINIAYSRKSIVGNRRLRTVLTALLKEGNIENTRIKFGVTASDLVTGEGVLFTNNDIISAVMASSSIPGFLPPFEQNGRQLVDGAIIHPVPVKAAREMGAEVVIAVDVTPNLTLMKKFDNIIDIIMRNNQMVNYSYNNLLLENADVIIRPKVGNFHWAEFNAINKLVKSGEFATNEALPQLEQVSKKRYRFLKKISGELK